MQHSNLLAVASFAALTLGAASAAAADQAPAPRAHIDPNHAFAMRFHLDADARAACAVDTNQGRMSMRMWQKQRQCLHDYFSAMPDN